MRAARRAAQAAQAGRDRDDARGWAWICGLSVGGWRRWWSLRARVRAVVAQSLAEKEPDGLGKTINIFKGPQIGDRQLEKEQGTSAFSVEERLQLEALDTRPEHSVNPNAIGDSNFITLLITGINR